jgi:hypothetical protein
MSETYIPAALRREVRDRAELCCEYCRIAEGDRAIDFAIDHVIAEKHGGKTSVGNLCLSCYECNSYKGSDLSSVDWGFGDAIIPLFNPRQQRWSEHFQLQGSAIHPLTPTGRVTVFLLRLNTPERLEERELLITLGDYPCRPIKNR